MKTRFVPHRDRIAQTLRGFLVLAVLAAVIAGPARSLAAQVGTDAKATELEGTWLGQTSAVGDAVRTFKPGEVRMTFRGTRLLAVGIVAPVERELWFSIDTTASPKHLDYWEKPESRTQCLYEVKGDSLIISVPRSLSGRASSLDPKQAGPRAIIMTLTRQK